MLHQQEHGAQGGLVQHGEDHARPGNPEDAAVDPFDGGLDIPLFQEDGSRLQHQDERIEGHAQADLLQEGMDVDQAGVQDVIELVPAPDIQEEQGGYHAVPDQAGQYSRADDGVVFLPSQEVRQP